MIIFINYLHIILHILELFLPNFLSKTSLGPTILFERFYGKGKSRKFYACSACRDRKQCAFFHWQDEKLTRVQQDFQSVR